MDIILLQDLEKVGEKHQVVKVKAGYGRNYLIPKGLAIVANEANRNRLSGIIRQSATKEAKTISAFRTLADKITVAPLRIEMKAGRGGRLYGSVTNMQVAAAIKAQFGQDIDRHIIEVPDEIKEVGHYTVTVNFHKEVHTDVKLQVVAEGGSGADEESGGSEE